MAVMGKSFISARDRLIVIKKLSQTLPPIDFNSKDVREDKDQDFRTQVAECK